MIWIVLIWICRDVLDWLRCKKNKIKNKLVGPLPQRGEDENEKADAKGGQAEKLIIYLTVAKKKYALTRHLVYCFGRKSCFHKVERKKTCWVSDSRYHLI